MKTHSWLFSKKRGNRRTDSQVIGLIAEVGFAVFCILAGVLGIVWITWCYIIPDWQIHKNYERTVCVLEDFRIIRKDIFAEDVVSVQEEKEALFTEDDTPANPENPESKTTPETDVSSESSAEPSSDSQTEDGGVTGVSGAESSNTANPTTNPAENPEAGKSETPADAEKTPTTETAPRVMDTGSILRQGLQKQFIPELYISYEVNGVGYKNWAKDVKSISRIQTQQEASEFLSQLKKGQRYYCWYDTSNPDNVVVALYWSWEHFCALLIPLSLLLLGMGALIHLYGIPSWGSKEYSAVAAQRAAQRTAQLKQLVDEQEVNPALGLPDVSEITDSPGIRLACRLPMEDSPAWNLLVISSVTLLWNLFVLVHVVLFGYSVYEEQTDWIRLIFIILPLATVGILMALWTVKKVRSATMLGPTLVELNQFPIARGETANLFLSQGGHLKIYWFNVLLVCEEEVVFTHGTNTRREIQRVFQRQLFCEENFEIKRAEPFETQFSLLIPQTAMHSFVSPHNQVKWKIIVQGTPANSPAFERAFPLIVLPESCASTEEASEKTTAEEMTETTSFQDSFRDVPEDLPQIENLSTAERYEVPEDAKEAREKEESAE